MVLLLDTDVDTPPDPLPWESAAATAVFLTSSQSKFEVVAGTLSLPSSLSKPPARLSLPSGQSEGMIYM